MRLNHKQNLLLQAQFFEMKPVLLYMELPKKAYQHSFGNKGPSPLCSLVEVPISADWYSLVFAMSKSEQCSSEHEFKQNQTAVFLEFLTSDSPPYDDAS